MVNSEIFMRQNYWFLKSFFIANEIILHKMVLGSLLERKFTFWNKQKRRLGFFEPFFEPFLELFFYKLLLLSSYNDIISQALNLMIYLMKMLSFLFLWHVEVYFLSEIVQLQFQECISQLYVQEQRGAKCTTTNSRSQSK